MPSDGTDLIWQTSAAPTGGVIGDVNTMRVDPSQLGMAMDCIIDTNGVLRNRGALVTTGFGTLTNVRMTGISQIPGAPVRSLMVGIDTAATAVKIYGSTSSTLASFSALTFGSAGQVYGSAQVAPSFARLSDDSGLVVACGATNVGMNNYGIPLMWGGNAATTSLTTAGTAAATIGSTAIVGVGTAWTSALEGCYLFIGSPGNYVGQVDKVSSTTTIVLKKGALQTVGAAAPNFAAGRYPIYFVYKGRITTNTASTTVVGSNTKFASSGPGGTGASYLDTTLAAATLFRYRDGAFVGTVASIPNDTTITLGANAAIAMVNEEYFLVCNHSNVAQLNNFPGAAFSATCVELYADRYWWGAPVAGDRVRTTLNGAGATNPYYSGAGVYQPFSLASGVIFSKKGDPECLDLDPVAGDTIKLPSGSSSDSVRGLCATRGGMVIFRFNDSFLLTGYSPETFRVIKLADDGLWYNNSFKPYKDGVIWAGRKSVWYFDGTRIVDLLQNHLKRFYRRTITNASSVTLGVGLTVASDNVLVSYNAGSNTWPYKNTTKTLNYVALNINMTNGACSFFTNFFGVNGFVHQDGRSIILASDNNTTSYMVGGETFFDESTTGSNNFDAVATIPTFNSGAQIGPDVQFETTKMALGDATRLKTWKRYLANYSSDVSMTASVIGTNNTSFDFPNISTGTASTDVLAASSGVGILHRLRYLVRAPALVVRVYQTNTTSATSQRFKLLWWAVGAKRMRQGRVQP